MNIVFASGTPLAGVSELNTRMVNEYFKGVHQARCLSKGAGRHKWYLRAGVKVPCYDIRDQDQVNDCLKFANILHCNANVSLRTMKRPDLIGKLTVVHQWHGGQFWPFERIWLPEDYKHVKFVSIGQGWIQRQAEFFSKFDITILPNLISMDDEFHRPLAFAGRTPGLVAFAPSTMKETAVNRKGVPEVQRAARIGGWKLDTITCCPFEECLARKRKAVLGIDEVVSPLYHRSGLEFLSQGTPCVCSYDAETEKTLKEATGSDVMPFINSSPATLNDTVKRFLGMPADAQQHAGREARRWMETFYHPKVLLQKYFDLYSK